MAIIEVENVSKLYRPNQGGRALFGRGGLRTLLRKEPVQKVAALRDITFTVEEGTSLGIIGANGSGKSTLLKIISGVTAPTEGSVKVYGRVASLLELGAGFHPMLSGRENIYLNAGILGMRRRQVDEVIDRIIDFSGVGSAIDYPVDTYSSGMYVRVAFAVAAHANPDVFLIDEVLSVGDESFQRQCRARIGELMEEGKTIVFVSHDLSIVNTLCERVILLSAGQMIVRDSSKNAIDFYLRQVGSEKGVHTFAHGDIEATACDGHVSLFYREREISAAGGFGVRLQNLGQWHSSRDAAWVVSERSDSGCVARGQMARLPIVLVWEFDIADGEIEWRIGFECEHDFPLEGMAIDLFFPSEYEKWSYDDESGTFPTIQPEDTIQIPITNPELLCEHAVLLAKDAANIPVVSMTLETQRSHLVGHWANSNYLTSSRCFHVEEHHMSRDSAQVKGVHEELVLRFRLNDDRQEIDTRLGEQALRYTLRVGELTARFDRGRVRIACGDQQVTSYLHTYSALLIGNLWTDTTTMRWEGFSRDGDTLRFEGLSRRFPYGLVWELSPAPSGIAMRIWLEAHEALEVNEYQVSTMVVPGYGSWETEHESGEFPDFVPGLGDWVHANNDYSTGKRIQAMGRELPTTTLEVNGEERLPRMTPINTTLQQDARVLQALYVSEQGTFHFDVGKHLLFEGKVTVEGHESSA